MTRNDTELHETWDGATRRHGAPLGTSWAELIPGEAEKRCIGSFGISCRRARHPYGGGSRL